MVTEHFIKYVSDISLALAIYVMLCWGFRNHLGTWPPRIPFAIVLLGVLTIAFAVVGV